MYERFASQMRGVALRYVSNGAEADDILQETFIRVFEQLNTYRDQGMLGAWIRRITINTALQQYRKQQVRQKHHDHYEEEIPTYAVNDCIQTLDLEAILEKIQALPEGYRVVFNLYAIEGFTHKEIGELLGINEGTSKSQYSRAKKLLQQQIHRDSDASTNQLSHGS